MLSRTGLCFICMSAAGVNLVGFSGESRAQDYGIDFVTIGSPGNAAFVPMNPPNEFFNNGGRGSVGYEYRIGRTEITTGQWMDFINTFWTQGNSPGGLFGIPSHWGAVRDTSYSGPGRRYRLPTPEAAMWPVFGISWRDSARYVNWLHNGQSTDLSALQNGAYDTSTFTTNADGTFNDQRRHHPDARFWIPTWDEWLKAAHYDPNRHGEGQEGWWLYPHGSDTQPIPGPPGVGETSAGFQIPPFGHFDIPLGAYPESLSPWGLMDTSGGAIEWTEETLEKVYSERRFRVVDGNFAGNIEPEPHLDQVIYPGVFDPGLRLGTGLRIASQVPSAPSGVGLGLAFAFTFCRRRRPC